tara:strand:- start:3406 stop:3879 length:474 start_codon:yes stop_codon:yes gene_type:complete
MLSLSNSIASPSYNQNIITEINLSDHGDWTATNATTFNSVSKGWLLQDSDDTWSAHSSIFSPTIAATSGIVSLNISYNLQISTLADSFKVSLVENSNGSGRALQLASYTSGNQDGVGDFTVAKHNQYKYLRVEDTHSEDPSNTTIAMQNIFIRYLSN